MYVMSALAAGRGTAGRPISAAFRTSASLSASTAAASATDYDLSEVRPSGLMVWPPSPSIVPQEISIDCGDGIRLAAQSWKQTTQSSTVSATSGATSGRRILCLHGWLDNCRSFHLLAPALVQGLSSSSELFSATTMEGEEGKKILQQPPTPPPEVVAIDMVGHGWSSHKSTDGPSVVLAESAYHIAQVLQKLDWTPAPQLASSHNNGRQDRAKSENEIAGNGNNLELNDTSSNGVNGSESTAAATGKVTLIGHSFGAAVSCLYAAAFPDQIDQVVLLDGVGPFSFPSEKIAQHVRRHIERRMIAVEKLNSPTNTGPRIYPSLEAAVRVRCQTARNSPGKQYLSETAARELVLRGSRFLDEPTNNDQQQQGDRRLSFQHDPRLLWPSITYFTPEQSEAVYNDIRESDCQVCLLRAEDGWPFFEDEFQKSSNPGTPQPITREQMLALLQPAVCKTLPGSHHFHADPDTAEQVAYEVISFLTGSASTANQTSK